MWASLFAVLAILTRPTLDVLAPILVLYFALVYHRLPQGRAARHLATYAAVYLALLSPWWLHNYKAYGTFVRLDLGSGLALYSNNNPRGPAVDSPESDPDRARFSAITDPVARDRAMWDAGVSYIKQDPGSFAALASRKFLRFWRPWPDAQAVADRSYFVLSVASFAPVLVLTFVYLRIWGRREIELIRFADMQPRLDGRPLVNGWLDREQISLLRGEAGCGHARRSRPAGPACRRPVPSADNAPRRNTGCAAPGRSRRC